METALISQQAPTVSDPPAYVRALEEKLLGYLTPAQVVPLAQRLLFGGGVHRLAFALAVDPTKVN